MLISFFPSLFILVNVLSFRTIGMFEQNNVGVRLVNPITTFVHEIVQNNDKDEAWLSSFLNEITMVIAAMEGEV